MTAPRTARRRRALPAPTTATPATSGYPYRIGPWELSTHLDAPACLPGMCAGCNDAGFSSTTPGLPYVPSTGDRWEDYVKWLCPDCLACSVICSGNVDDFRRYPPLLAIREPNGTFTTSPRAIRVTRKGNVVTLLATTTTGQHLPVVVLRDALHEWRIREAYAQLARALDAADPVPPFVPPLPHDAKLPLNP